MGIQVTCLLQLISLEIKAVRRHSEAGSHRFIIEQYEDLRDQRLAELTELLQSRGLTVQLEQGNRKEMA